MAILCRHSHYRADCQHGLAGSITAAEYACGRVAPSGPGGQYPIRIGWEYPGADTDTTAHDLPLGVCRSVGGLWVRPPAQAAAVGNSGSLPHDDPQSATAT